VEGVSEMVDTDRWQQILQTASQVFMEKGYKGATLDEIAGRLNMTKAALYYYVSGKDELWIKCHVNAIDFAMNHVWPIYKSDLPPAEKLHEMVKMHVQIVIGTVPTAGFILYEKSFIPPSISLSKLTDQRDRYEEMFSSVIQEGVSMKIFRPVNIKITKLVILGATNFIPHWYSPNGELSPQEISEIFAEHLVSGILAAPQNPN
jgi:AcrR family transcriptional regulator